jgi:hypothetical protein
LARRTRRKSAAVQALGRRGVVKLLFGTQIPASTEALIKVARPPCRLIAARHAAKSEAA